MLKAIGNTPIQPLHRASCHCGAVVLEIRLPTGLPDPHRCDCSFCKRKGAIVAAVPEADLKVLKGESALRKYQFGKKVAEHFFAACAVSIPITEEAPIRKNLVSISAAWMA